jgi:hypothetical protein
MILTLKSDWFLEQRWQIHVCNGDGLGSLWGTDWILKYYLDELRLQRVNSVFIWQQNSLNVTTCVYILHEPARRTQIFQCHVGCYYVMNCVVEVQYIKLFYRYLIEIIIFSNKMTLLHNYVKVIKPYWVIGYVLCLGRYWIYSTSRTINLPSEQWRDTVTTSAHCRG